MLAQVLETVLFGGIPAAVFALLPLPGAGGPRGAAIRTGLAVAAGFVGIGWRLSGAPVLSPVQSSQWLPHTTILGAVVGSLVTAFTGGLLDAAARYAPNEGPDSGSGAGHGAESGGSFSAIRLRPAATLIAGIISGTAASFALLFSYTAKLAQTAGGLCAALSAILTIHLIFPRQVASWPVRFATGAPILWLVWIGWKFSEMEPPAAALVAASVLPVVVPSFAGEIRRPLKSVIVRAGLALVLGGAGVVFARLAYEPFAY